jgi:hypothetical protein
MMILSFEHYLEQKRKVDATLDKLHDKLSIYPKGSMGLVSEEVRLDPEYRRLTKEFNNNFQLLRALNAFASKHYKKELRALSFNVDGSRKTKAQREANH